MFSKACSSMRLREKERERERERGRGNENQKKRALIQRRREFAQNKKLADTHSRRDLR